VKSKNPKVRKKLSSRLSKVLSLILGVLMFMFGLLKFFQPFRGWFVIQIQQSHLPHESILAGKLTEMLTGCLFLLPWLRKSLTARSKDQLLLIACSILVAQMGTAIYVHLQPQVPASVLPLGIKPPVIPVVVLLLGLLTAFSVWKERRAEKASDTPAQ
jgi:uncharacterized membrane protein YfcA